MRKIKPTHLFKRDFAREKAGPFQKTIDEELAAVFSILAKDDILPAQYRDHRLVGQ